MLRQKSAVTLLLANFFCFGQSTPARQTQNVIFVMTDGLRWQEVFRGAEADLMNKDLGGVENAAPLQKLYGGATPDERRKKLLPFLWSTVAQSGQIYGNRDKQSDAEVTNGLNFSYPGYSEALCGFADPRVNSNDKVPNPNQTVFEWLNDQAAFHDRVAAFGAWDVFPFIFNAARSHIPVNAGYQPLDLPGSPEVALLNQLKTDQPHYWDDEPFDAVPFYTALDYLKARHPRLLFISLGETDDWAHEKRYDLYLESAHHADDYLRALWETVNSLPEYKGHTTLIFGTDHGRGSGAQWVTHGEKVPDSKYVWMMFLGPDTAALGERSNIPAVTQSQIAGTIAALLGTNYQATVPKSGAPITDVIKPGA